MLRPNPPSLPASPSTSPRTCSNSLSPMPMRTFSNVDAGVEAHSRIRTDAARLLQRHHPPPRPRDQAWRRLPAHAAHPRRAGGPAQREGGTQEAATARSHPRLGARVVRTHRPQQGGRRTRQQTGAPAVGCRTSPHELRSRPRQRARHAGELSSHPALHRVKRRWQTSRSPGRPSR